MSSYGEGNVSFKPLGGFKRGEERGLGGRTCLKCCKRFTVRNEKKVWSTEQVLRNRTTFYGKTRVIPHIICPFH